jgi:hypothetical protein
MDDSGIMLRDFVLRIIAGEPLNTPEDLQFYMNNRSAIEELLKIYGDDENPFYDIKDID